MIALLVLLGTSAVSIGAERIEYYVWTDDEGVTHASGAPPEGDVDYEKRTLGADENVVVNPRREAAATAEDGQPDRGVSAAGEPQPGRGSDDQAASAEEGLSGGGKAIVLDDAIAEREPSGDSREQEEQLTEGNLLNQGEAAGADVPPRGLAPEPTGTPLPPSGPVAPTAPPPPPPALPAL